MSGNLIQRAKAGDKQAFAQLYLSNRDSLFRYAYFKLGNVQDAQDAVSDCIAEAYAGVTLLKSEKAFTSWLFKILYRECCRILRMRSVKSAEESLDLSAEIPVYDSHLAPELEEALKTLQPDERDIVLLSVISGTLYVYRLINKCLFDHKEKRRHEHYGQQDRDRVCDDLKSYASFLISS